MSEDDAVTRTVNGRSLEISRPDKVLFPDSGVTKMDLVEHYEAVAEVMLPHVEGRPVSMHRFPDGIEGEGFYQKEVPEYFPDWIHTEEVEKEGGTLRQLVVDDAATLVYLANQACITPHVWTSRVDRLRQPDRMIFDLDPPGTDWEEAFDEVRWAARTLRDALERLGLTAFVMTSGSKGLHLHVPVERGPGFDEVRSLARELAELLARRSPERLTVEQRKESRGDRIFLDVGRNAYAQTAVAPYSVRARPGAPVAAPLDWEELGGSGMGPRRYHVENIRLRLGQRDDPWKNIASHAAALGKARAAMEELHSDEAQDVAREG